MVDETQTVMPQYYQIRLKGHLDERRLHHFEGFDAVLLSNGETLLTGQIVDQSALHGILNHIRDMGIPLLEVRCLESLEG